MKKRTCIEIKEQSDVTISSLKRDLNELDINIELSKNSNADANVNF